MAVRSGVSDPCPASVLTYIVRVVLPVRWLGLRPVYP